MIPELEQRVLLEARKLCAEHCPDTFHKPYFLDGTHDQHSSMQCTVAAIKKGIELATSEEFRDVV